VQWLLLGSIPGVLVGSHVTARISDVAVRISLGAVLAASGIELAAPPHAHVLLAGVMAWPRISAASSAAARKPALPLAQHETGPPWTDV